MVSVISILKPGFPNVTSGEDVFLAALPFYHISGKYCLSIQYLSINPKPGSMMLIHFPLSFGIPVVVMPKYHPVEFCSNIEKYSITSALVVPPILLSLIHHPGMHELYVINPVLSLTHSDVQVLYEVAQIPYVR